MTIEHTSKLIALWTLAACVLAPIVGRFLRACDLRNQASRHSEASELADSLGVGGAADSIPVHDPLIIEGAQRNHV